MNYYTFFFRKGEVEYTTVNLIKRLYHRMVIGTVKNTVNKRQIKSVLGVKNKEIKS